MKIERITKKDLVKAIKEENLGTFTDAKEASKEAGMTGICQTEKGNYMVYSINGKGKMFNTSVHANRREANGMALRRLRRAAACNAAVLMGV